MIPHNDYELVHEFKKLIKIFFLIWILIEPLTKKKCHFIDYTSPMLMSVLITIFNAKPHLQAVMKAYMRVLKNLHDIVFQYLINLPQPHHNFFTFQ